MTTIKLLFSTKISFYFINFFYKKHKIFHNFYSVNRKSKNKSANTLFAKIDDYSFLCTIYDFYHLFRKSDFIWNIEICLFSLFILVTIKYISIGNYNFSIKFLLKTLFNENLSNTIIIHYINEVHALFLLISF